MVGILLNISGKKAKNNICAIIKMSNLYLYIFGHKIFMGETCIIKKIKIGNQEIENNIFFSTNGRSN